MISERPQKLYSTPADTIDLRDEEMDKSPCPDMTQDFHLESQVANLEAQKEHSNACEAFNFQKIEYESKVVAGANTPQDDILWETVVKEEVRRRKKRRLDQFEDADNTAEEEIKGVLVDSEQEIYAKNEHRSWHSQIDAEQDSHSKKKSNKQESAKKPKPNTFDPNKYLGGAKGSGQLQDDPGNARDFASIFAQSDVFIDSEKTAEKPDLPTFTAVHAASALKEMVSTYLETGPRTKDQKESAKADRRLLLKARHLFHNSNKPSADGDSGWRLPRMKSSLKHHQLIGTSWMRWRETSAKEPFGGLFADAMGLGKTIQMLANIVDSHPTKDAKRNGTQTTLIVLPASLLQQWKGEIQAHCMEKSVGTIMIFNSKAIQATNQPLSMLDDHDIILTTYDEVIRSYPKVINPQDLRGEERKVWWKAHFEQNRRLLHQKHFYRVVLDEAQAIKNPKAQIEEIYPYFKFLGVPYTADLKIFRKNYCNGNDPDHAKRLSEVLRTYAFRRTHQNELFGAPIQKLPSASERTTWCTQTSFEEAAYNAIIALYGKKYHACEDGQTTKSVILSMIGSLKRLSSHPLLLQMDFAKLDGEAIMSLRQAYEESALEEKSFRDKITELQRQANNITDTGPEAPLPSTGGQYGRVMSFEKYFKALQALQSQHAKQSPNYKPSCGFCNQEPIEPLINYCNHIFCRDCAEESQNAIACPQCTNILHDLRPCTIQDLKIAAEAIPLDTKDRKRTAKKRIKSSIDWIDLPGLVMPSTKTLAVKAQVLCWLADNPHCKIIIFTQYRDMIRILKRICDIEQWKCCEIHGEITPAKRDVTLTAFKEDKSISILLSTLGTGGLGLNLVAATKVIIMEPWWNSALDQQAFCRVWRMGQQEKTELVRICIKGTMDERVMDIQNDKAASIAKIAMNVDLRKLNANEMIRLFGPFDRPDGQAFILVEDTPVPRNETAITAEDDSRPAAGEDRFH